MKKQGIINMLLGVFYEATGVVIIIAGLWLFSDMADFIQNIDTETWVKSLTKYVLILVPFCWGAWFVWKGSATIHSTQKDLDARPDKG